MAIHVLRPFAMAFNDVLESLNAYSPFGMQMAADVGVYSSALGDWPSMTSQQSVPAASSTTHLLCISPPPPTPPPLFDRFVGQKKEQNEVNFLSCTYFHRAIFSPSLSLSLSLFLSCSLLSSLVSFSDLLFFFASAFGWISSVVGAVGACMPNACNQLSVIIVIS